MIAFLFISLIGLVLGSFAAAITYRELQSISWISGRSGSKEHPPHRSACPHCKARLKPYDLVPLLSYLLLRGRCRYCSAVISPSYPLIELSVLVGCWGIYSCYGLGGSAPYLYAAVPFLVALCVIDIKQMILPDRLVAALGVLALLSVAIQLIAQDITLHAALFTYGGGLLLYAALAGLTGFLLSKILKKEALGLGDVKFFAVAGLWLGVAFLPWFYLISGILGVVLGVLWPRLGGQKTFPFGPALIIALYVLLLIKA